MKELKGMVKNTILENNNSLTQKEIENLAENLGRQLGDLIEAKKEQFNYVKNTSENMIQNHPFLYVGGAFLAGALVGLILNKK